jgi:hypothetical protein
MQLKSISNKHQIISQNIRINTIKQIKNDPVFLKYQMIIGLNFRGHKIYYVTYCDYSYFSHHH